MKVADKVVNAGMPARINQQTQFTGSTAALQKRVLDAIPGGKAIKRLQSWDYLRGEAGGILINSIGTGAVAPLCVAYNPFMKPPKNATPEQKKEMDNTKKYTAWRQPISAILAIIIQLGVQKPINIALDSVFNNPDKAKNLWLGLDQSVMNNDSFLKRKITKEMKKDKTLNLDKDAFKEELNKRVEAAKAKQLDSVLTEFKRSGKIIIGERTVDNKTVAEILNKNIDSYIKDAKDLRITEEGLKYYQDKAELIMRNKDDLKNLLSDIPKDSKELENYLKGIVRDTDKPEIKKLINEILDGTEESLRGSKCQRTLERIDKITEACSGNYSTEKYLKSMIRDNGILQEVIVNLKRSKIDDFENISSDTIKSTIDKVKKLCHYKEDSQLSRLFHDTDNFLPDADKLLNKIQKEVVNGYKKVVQNKYKGFNQFSKIAIGIAITTPITCTALNWVYPRFMDLVFPNLSGKKKNGGEK